MRMNTQTNTTILLNAQTIKTTNASQSHDKKQKDDKNTQQLSSSTKLSSAETAYELLQ